MKHFIQWLKNWLPTDKGDHIKELQETMLLGICCELLMKEKSATFQGKVAQEMRKYCVLVAKTCFSDNAPEEMFACHMNFHLRHHGGHHAHVQEKKDQGRLVWECQTDLLCQQQTACWYN